MSADLVQIVIGIALFGFGFAVWARVRSKTRTWTAARQARLVLVPALIGVIFFVIAFATAALGAVWVVPTGFAVMAVVELAVLRMNERRSASHGSAG